MNTTHFFPELFDVYRISSDATPNLLGEGPAASPDSSDMDYIGRVRARVNTGDSLEPDVRGVIKDYNIDLTSMWLGWIDMPDGFILKTGDLLRNPNDHTRAFQIQFLDTMPGGITDHHIECRLQTTEAFRNT